MLPISLNKDGWQVAAHRHLPLGSMPDLSNFEEWDWHPASLPFDAITWLETMEQGPHPLVNNNDISYKWVENVDWVLRHKFTLPAGIKNADDDTYLVLTQLDCFFDAFLNGQHIGGGQNQFRDHLIDVDENLLSIENELIIYIRSARNVTTVLEAAYGQLPAAFDSQRVHARRCQSITGWDWTARFSSVALLNPPELRANSAVQMQSFHIFAASISEVKAGDIEAHQATLNFTLDMFSRRKASGTLSIEITDTVTGESVYSTTEPIDLKAKSARLKRTITLSQAKLWWPLGMGDQHIYCATVIVSVTDKLQFDHSLQHSTRFGIRTATIEKQKDAAGESFVPTINGVPVFCRGANWILTQVLPARVNTEDTRKLLIAAAGAGMNCLRVWGGGIYETDDFYACCDQLGILVWQDFMFSCASYPTYREFLEEVEAEAVHQVTRMRNHPCILLWCGNNENEWLHQTGELRKGNEQKVIGEAIWSHLLRQIVEDHDPSRYYHLSSPSGKYKTDLNDEGTGDRHSWDAWANWRSEDILLQDTGRFITEFGNQSLPSRESLEHFAPNADSLYHPELLYHQKMDHGQERIVRYVAGQLPPPANLDDWIVASQQTQAEFLRRAVEHWRQNRFHTAGALVWHLHDAYTAISCSLIDWYRRPKLSYHAARRFFAPVLVSMRLVVDDNEVSSITPEYWTDNREAIPPPISIAGGTQLECIKANPCIQVRLYIINDTFMDLSGDLTLEFVLSDSDPVVLDTITVRSEPNCSYLALTHEIGKSLLKEIRNLTVRAQWVPDEKSHSLMKEFGHTIRKNQQNINTGDDIPPHFRFDENIGLTVEQKLVEAKYYHSLM